MHAVSQNSLKCEIDLISRLPAKFGDHRRPRNVEPPNSMYQICSTIAQDNFPYRSDIAIKLGHYDVISQIFHRDSQ